MDNSGTGHENLKEGGERPDENDAPRAFKLKTLELAF